jgi:molecular chaperone DnaJ
LTEKRDLNKKTEEDFSGFGDIFDFFGGGNRRGPQSGADLLMHIQIPLVDAISGVDREIEIVHTEPCTSCNGTGNESKNPNICSQCGGTGQVRTESKSFLGTFVSVKPCTMCKGIGKIPGKMCNECLGVGYNHVRKKVSVHIPAGISNGVRLRVEGYGEAGDYGKKNGDLFIEVHFQQPGKNI